MRWLVLFLSCSLFAESPLDRLMEGNLRYVEGRLEHPNRSEESRKAVAISQAPFAAIMGCSDSRVAPEILFDQGIGDVFVIRVAGNVVGPLEIDSAEYAAANLGASLIMVLGHEGCGAVKAVLEGQASGIESVAELIEPAVAATRGMKGDPLENAVKKNVEDMVEILKATPVLSNLISEKKLVIVGGYYSLVSGKVNIVCY